MCYRSTHLQLSKARGKMLMLSLLEGRMMEMRRVLPYFLIETDMNIEGNILTPSRKMEVKI